MSASSGLMMEPGRLAIDFMYSEDSFTFGSADSGTRLSVPVPYRIVTHFSCTSFISFILIIRIPTRPHDLTDNLVSEFVDLGRQFFGSQVTVPILLTHRSVGELLQDLVATQSLGVTEELDRGVVLYCSPHTPMLIRSSKQKQKQKYGDGKHRTDEGQQFVPVALDSAFI